MARHYSTKDFLRQVPTALLARYFAARGALQGFDFAAITETKIDALFAAWLDLPEQQRHAMDAEFADICAMSCEKGWLAIIDETHWQMRSDPAALTDFVEALAALPNHYHTKGLGTNCVVEPFRRGDLDYFFAYPEDYSQQSIESWNVSARDAAPLPPAAFLDRLGPRRPLVFGTRRDSGAKESTNQPLEWHASTRSRIGPSRSGERVLHCAPAARLPALRPWPPAHRTAVRSRCGPAAPAPTNLLDHFRAGIGGHFQRNTWSDGQPVIIGGA